MAPNRKPAPGDQPQQEEMTVVVMKFKGSGQSLQKGFDAVTQAIAALGAPQNNNHRVVAPRSQTQIAGGEEILDGDTHDMEDPGEAEDIEQAASAPAAPSRTKKGYIFMDDFNLAPAGVPALHAYCTEKNPQTNDDKFLVASAWIQTHGGVEFFSGRHLFTAFRSMDWKTQVDMTQPLRSLKSRKSFYDNPSQGNWKLTGIGLKAAEKIGTE